ncbi:MAG: transaldolase [Frankia sp.]|nr:transaldolase [Frankia sp.]
MTNPLSDLSAAGVAVWLDDISRDRLRTGNLADLMATHSVVGVTTNPTIFQKAVVGSDAYDEQLRDLTIRGVDVGEAVRLITTADVRSACDVLRPVFDATGGLDGRVSIEVDPRLAHDTEKTVAEARALWWMVDRPNLFIKIPATREGLPAITAALAAGISVNVTLIFSLDRYDEVMDAYMSGVEQALAAGRDVSQLASVASFFVSRVDTEVDKRLEKIGSPQARALRSRAAVANARLAYERYEKAFGSERWAALAAAGARPQRPLWASTSTKDPSLPDTIYVKELIAAGTVNTMPESTLLAFADHGEVAPDTVRPNYADAHETMAALAAVGIDMADVVEVLEREGVAKFEDSWNQLLDAVRGQLAAAG